MTDNFSTNGIKEFNDPFIKEAWMEYYEAEIEQSFIIIN